MSSRPIIDVQGLSKRYSLGSGPRRSAPAAGHRWWPGRRTQADAFWALRDVSFRIERGETVGLVGGNGAGKSTLLKLLARITRPTSGQASIQGRVGALLEVGSGFHPELTGRENIFLNGTILGMRRAEVRRKFDEIVAFAGTERFLDVPVKRYSSGMYVRLAFAVAAHLDPEILIVDEVLAVGDAAFQKKCLGTMGQAAAAGRTVLFVSHNLGLVQSLCGRGLLLQSGQVRYDGDSAGAVSRYLQSLEERIQLDVAHRTDRRGLGTVRLVGLSVQGAGPTSSPATGAPARFRFEFDQALPGLGCEFLIFDDQGQPVASFQSADHGPEDDPGPDPGRILVCEIDELPLRPGTYRIDVATTLGRHDLLDHLEAAGQFEVSVGALRGRPIHHRTGQGSVCIPHRWSSTTDAVLIRG